MNTRNMNKCRRDRGHPIRKWLIGRRLRKLGLDDRQKEQLDALFADACKAGGTPGYGRGELLRTMMTEQGFDQGRAEALIRETADRHVRYATETVASFGDFYQGLQPWQQAEIRNLQHRRRRCRTRCCH